MKTLVTGGAGFIGSTLTDALLADGHGVTVVDDLSRGRMELVDPKARFIRCDVSSPDLTAAVAEVRPEVVFHQAAQIDVRRSVSEPLFDAQVNVMGMVNLLQACVAGGVRRVIFASSGGAAYGDTESIPTREDHPFDPASGYGVAKVASELYGRVSARIHGLDFVALRYANVYGPRQDPHGEAGVVAIFAQRLLAAEDCVINGDGGQTRDYVFVDDVVRANLLAMAAPNLGAYNIATGTETSVTEIYGRLARAAGVDRPPVFGPAKSGEQQRSCLDISHSAAELGWQPAVPLGEGIERTLKFFGQRPG